MEELTESVVLFEYRGRLDFAMPERSSGGEFDVIFGGGFDEGSVRKFRERCDVRLVIGGSDLPYILFSASLTTHRDVSGPETDKEAEDSAF